jgi:hypothetical protein
MSGAVVGTVMMVAGSLCAWIGIEAAAAGSQRTQEKHRRATTRSRAEAEGWDGWFFHGFAGLTAGLGHVASVAAWLAWTSAGICFLGLGAHFVSR